MLQGAGEDQDEGEDEEEKGEEEEELEHEGDDESDDAIQSDTSFLIISTVTRRDMRASSSNIDEKKNGGSNPEKNPCIACACSARVTRFATMLLQH